MQIGLTVPVILHFNGFKMVVVDLLGVLKCEIFNGRWEYEIDLFCITMPNFEI